MGSCMCVSTVVSPIKKLNWIIFVEGIESMKMTLNHGIMKLLHWLTKFYTWHVIYSNITPTIDLTKKPHPPFPMEAKEGGIKWHINLLTLKRFANIKNKWIFLIKKVHILVAIGNNAFGGLQGTLARHVSSTNSFIHDNF